MQASLLYAIVIFASASSPLPGAQSLDSIQKMEASGDSMGARSALARATQANPNSVAAWTAYAEFLDRYGDPAAREAYGKLLTALRNGGDSARAAAVSRRLALLDLLAGDRAAAGAHLDTYRAAGGIPSRDPARGRRAALRASIPFRGLRGDPFRCERASRGDRGPGLERRRGRHGAPPEPVRRRLVYGRLARAGG